MKKNVIGILLILFIALSTFSCSKIGSPPYCKITYPLDGQIIDKCETIDITVIAEGNGTETNITINGVFKVNQHSGSNITFQWSTNTADIKEHTIIAACWDNKGAKSVDEIKVKVVAGASETFTDPRDMQEYYIVDIGSQTWFAQDLRYYTSDTGCIDNNGPNDGVIYNWYSAKIACPNGWHLPSDSEWKTLEKHIGMSDSEVNNTRWRGSNEGNELKCKCGWGSMIDSGHGNDHYHFTALPDYKDVYGFGTSNIWWTNTEAEYFTVFVRSLQDWTGQIERAELPKDLKNSVRCIKDY